MSVKQLAKKPRLVRFYKNTRPALKCCPQKKTYCLKVTIRAPKKPNSARRKVARVEITSTRKKIYCYIPGIGHSIRKHSTLFIRGGRRQDLPGIKYTIIRGKADADFPLERKTARSKYGIQKPKRRIAKVLL
jgi:small subunit ribosomal protein S12